MAETDTLERPEERAVTILPQIPAESGATDFSSASPPGGFLSGPRPSGLTDDLADVEARRGAALERSGRELDSHLAQDRSRMERAFNLEAAAATDPSLKPWNADEERARRTRDPMEQFGSVGSVFAMAASLFTRAPMTSALNAGAAAMTAIQKSDERGYESAYEAWKSNTDLALKRFGMEHQVFSDANALMSSDMNAWRSKQLAIAAQYDNKKALVFLQNGMDKELLDMYQAQQRGAIELQRARNEFETYDRDRRIFQDGMAAYKEGNPEATPQQELQHKLQLIHDIKSGARSWQQEALRNFELTTPNATPEQRQQFMQSLRGGAASRPLSPEQEFTKRFWEQNPKASFDEFSEAFGKFKQDQKAEDADQRFISEFFKDHPEAGVEEFSKAFGEWKKGQKTAAGGRVTTNTVDAAEIERLRTENITAGMEPGKAFEDAKARVAATNMTKMTGAQLKSAGVIEMMRKNPGMSIEDATKRFDEATKPGTAFTKEAIDLSARLLIRGNPLAVQNVGRGKQGEVTLAEIRNRAADILVKERGLSTEDAAKVINENTAAFMGDKRGASNLALRMSTIFGAATTALATADRVIETSEKVDRTEFSDLNKIILSAEQRTGSKEVIDYGIAINTLVNNYARAIGGGSAALTDTARREAHELLQAAWSKGQVKSAIAQLKRELYFELEGAKEARKAWQEGKTPFPEGAVPDSGSGVIEYDNKGNRVEKRSSLDEGRVVSDVDERPGAGEQYAMMDDPRARKGVDKFGNAPSGGGGPSGAGGGPVTGPARVQQIEKLVQEGKSPSQIMKDLGIKSAEYGDDKKNLIVELSRNGMGVIDIFNLLGGR